MAKKLVTMFGAVCEITDEPVMIQRQGVITQTDMIVEIVERHTGIYHQVMRNIIEAMPETIERDSFVYKP